MIIQANENPQTDSSTIWGKDRQAVNCNKCGKIFLIIPATINKICPLCFCGQLVPVSALLIPILPELIIDFQIELLSITTSLKRYIGDVWLRPKDFQLSNIIARLTPIFIPVWLVDTNISGDWQVKAGFVYQVKSNQDVFTNNQWQTREIYEDRVKWEPRLGHINKRYQNIVLPAIEEHRLLMNHLGEYHIKNAVPFESGICKDFDILTPEVDPETAINDAKLQLNAIAETDCQIACGARHFNNFLLQANYEQQYWTQMLLPLYSTHYSDDDGVSQTIIINGQTGKISGKRLASQKEGWKIGGLFGITAIILFTVSMITLILGAAIPPISIIGLFLAFLAIIIGLFTLVPIIYPWQWNRRQQDGIQIKSKRICN